jgi:uncharacterized protein YjbI with pentapeptide repeats
MREADMTGLRAHGASLRRLDLGGAWLHKSDLSGADLRGSDLSDVDPTALELKGAIIDAEQAMQLVTGLGLDVRPS